MILEKNEVVDTNNKKYIECIYDSSNIGKTIYFVDNEKLYIFFKRGHGYSFINVDKDLYEEFENAESQGRFFNKNIKNNPIHQYRYEYKLLKEEIDEVEKIIEENKKSKNDGSEENIN